MNSLTRGRLEKLLAILFIPLVLLVRLIRPLVWIRFGPIISSTIGHFVYDMEYYLKEKEFEQSRKLDFFYFEHTPPSNTQWADMVCRHVKVHPIVRYLDRANQMIPGGELHRFISLCKRSSMGTWDVKDILYRTSQHITFTKNEDEKGRQILRDLGLQTKDRFICLLVRDSAYKAKYHKYGANNQAVKPKDWSYHDFRDSDINTYEKAALALAEKGYFVFRMGKIVHKPFKAKHGRIIDYANTPHRSDFLDIWLMANCYFTITNISGLDSVAKVFHRPIVSVNSLPEGRFNCYLDKSIAVFKTLRWIDSQKNLSLKEQIQSKVIYIFHTDKYKEQGIEYLDNTPEEIADIVLEMEARLNGTWKENPDDARLQDRYWEIMKTWEASSSFHKQIRGKIGAVFLRNNHRWLFS